MRALISDHHDSVIPGQVPEPDPAPDQALVRVEAISINRGETFQLEDPAPGWRPGKDLAGTVLQAAADGSGPEAGVRVVGHAPHSSWAERIAIGTDRVVPLPDDVPTRTAAALGLAGLTGSIAQVRQLTAVGWAQAFSDVVTFAIVAVFAAVVARRMRVPDRV